MKTKFYETPAIESREIETEGMLCASGAVEETSFGFTPYDEVEL